MRDTGSEVNTPNEEPHKKRLKTSDSGASPQSFSATDVYNRLSQVTFDGDDSDNPTVWSGIDQINSYINNQAIKTSANGNELAYYVGPNNFAFDSEEGINDIAKHICRRHDIPNSFYGSRESLDKPFIVVSNTATALSKSYADINRVGGLHWISWVLLPKKYVSLSGKEINNDKYQVLFFDSLSHASFPEHLKNFLTKGGQITERTDTGEIQMRLMPFCKREEIDFIDLKHLTGQQMNSNDCGWWAVYYALMSVYTGGVEFLEELKGKKLSAKPLRELMHLQESQDHSNSLLREPISIFKEIDHEEDQSNKQNLVDLLKKLRASYSDDLRIGVALKTGDCFFDSIAQGLNELKDKGLVKNSERFNVKSLRKDCASYAITSNNEGILISKDIIKDADYGGYFVAKYGPYGAMQDPVTKNNLIDEHGTFVNYLNRIQEASDQSLPIWGRPEIEGRMISNKYDVVLYFYSTNEENGQKIIVTKITPGNNDLGVFIKEENFNQLHTVSDQKVVRIVNYKQHFVPLLSSLKEDIKKTVPVSRRELYGRKVNNPIPPDILFIGREVELQDLHDKMQSGRRKVVVSQVDGFNTLGGVGKTSLVLEYVKRYGHHYEDNIRFIDAGSEASLTKIFHQMWDSSEENNKDLDDTCNMASIVKNVYESLSDNLFILDDAKNDPYLFRFLPESFLEENSESPKVLITSRSQDWPPSFEVIKLGGLSTSEARSLVIRGLGSKIDSQDKRIDILTRELSFSPASIKQAIGYIRSHGWKRYDIGDYLAQYRREKTSYLDLTTGAISRGSCDEATFIAFKTTMEKIKSGRKNSQVALSVLNVLSYLAPRNIKKGFLGTLITTLSKKELESALRLLKKYLITSTDSLTQLVHVSQSAQEVVRIELKQTNKDKEIIKNIVRSLGSALSSENYFVMQEWFPHLEKILHHVDDLLVQQDNGMTEVEQYTYIRLLKYIIESYVDVHHIEKSRELLVKILQISKNQPIVQLSGVLAVTLKLTNHASELGAYDVIIDEIDKFQPLVVDNLEALQLLADNFSNLAEYNKEREVLQKIITIHYQAGNYLEFSRTMVKVGICHHKLLNYYTAVTMFKTAHAMLTISGGSSGEVSSCLEFLALNQENLGLYTDSIENLQKVLDIKDLLFGIHTVEYATVLRKIGLLYLRTGDRDEAISCSEESLKIMEDNGVEDYQIPEFLHLLNMVYQSFSLYEKRTKIIDRILAIEEVYRDSVPQVVDLFHEAAKTYGDVGDLSMQAIFLKKYLAQPGNLLDKYLVSCSERIKVLRDLASILLSLGEYQKAQSVLEELLMRESVDIASTGGSVGIIERIGLLNDLEKSSRLSSNFERVNEVRKLKWQIQKNNYKYRWGDARTLQVVGDNFRDLNDFSRAKDSLEKALSIREKKNEPFSVREIQLLESLSKVYDNLGYFDKKIEVLNKILEIQRDLNKHITLHEASTLEILGRSYFELGEHNVAYRRLMQSLIIKKYFYETENSDVMSIIEWLADTYIDQNYPGQSRGILGRGRVEELTLETLSKPRDQLSEYEKKSISLIGYLTSKHNVHKRRDFDMITTLEWLARICVSGGYKHLGRKLLERAMDIVISNEVNHQVEVPKDLFNEYPSLGIDVKSLADAFVEFFNDHIQAEKLLSQALKIEKAFHGSNSLQVISQLRMLARTNQVMGNLVTQKALLREASSILEQQGKANRHWSMEFLVEAANVHRDLGNPVKQREYLEKAYLIIGDSRYLGRVPDPVDVMQELSLCYENFPGLELKQKNLLEDILVTQKHRFGYEHFELVKTLEGLSKIYLSLDRPNKQEEKLKEGLSILDLHKDKYQDARYRFLEELSKIYLGTGDDEKFSYYEERIKSEFPSGACLAGSSSSGMRRKREASGESCLFTWEDVDEFNEEKDEKRDFSKIKIDSEKFVSYTKDLPEEKKSQLIQLADEKGSSSGIVSKLISNQRVMNHLGRVGKISGMTMHGMMAKNVLADFLNGDYKGVAVNVGFIAGGQGFAKVSEYASLKGIKLAEEGKALLGSSLKAASPFLARATSAFVIYDLVNQIKALKNGAEEAIVDVVGDSIYLGVDAVEIGVGVAEAFGALEGVSSVTGPIGTAISSLVFVGTDIYMAVKKVEKMDQAIHLTGNEKFIEGLLAFMHMKPEEYIEELMEEKALYNQLVKQGFEYLKKLGDIQSYVFPTGKLVKYNCTNGSITRYTYRAIPYRDYYTDCMTRYEVDLNNTVLLDRERYVEVSRVTPDYPSNGEPLCALEGNFSFKSYSNVNYNLAYLCKNAIGTTDSSINKTGKYTLFALGEGDDTSIGFKDSPNIFLVGDGYKSFTGGDKDDFFILTGDDITGTLEGGDGIDTLDLTGFAQNAESLNISLGAHTGEIIYSRNDLGAYEMERVLGRKGNSESIFSACDTKFLDGQGSAKNNSDYIVIRNEVGNNVCDYNIQIVVRPNTNINNKAYNGEFNYIVLPQKGKAVVNISSLLDGEVTDRHNFFFNSSVSQLVGINIQNVTRIFNHTVKSATFSFLSIALNKSESELQSHFYEERFDITISDIPVNTSYIIGNGAQVKMGTKGNIYILESTNKSSEEVIREYLPIANRVSKMSFFIQSLLSNETVVIGSGNHEVIHNNPAYRSHLVGNGGENVYVIDSETKEVIIHDVDEENSIDTIDLRNVARKAKEVQIIKSGNDLLLKAKVKEQGSSCTVRLKDGVERYNKTHVIVENVPMTIKVDNNQWSLKPQPLIFEKDKEFIIVTSQDIEENTELITPRRAGNYRFVSDHGSDLIVTNAFDVNVAKNDLCTIVLSKFYEELKMATLSIKFADKEIILKDHQEEISTARDVNVVKKEHKDQVYNDVFNLEVIMLSDQLHSYRHENSRHTRHRRSTTSSSTRPTAWINDLFGWVKSSISGLLSFKPESTPSPISQIDAKIDVNGTIMLLDVLVRKFTGKQYIPAVDQSIPLLEARGYALNITNRFEKVLNKTDIKSGISVTNLNFDPVVVQSAIIGKIRNGRFSEIAKTLYSFAKEACPKFKQTDKFLAHLKSNLEEVLAKEETMILKQKVERTSKDLSQEVSRKVDLSKKPNLFLNETSVVRGISRVIN